MDKHYIGLGIFLPVGPDGGLFVEPARESGYARAEVEFFQPAGAAPVMFPNSVGIGYGRVTHYAIFDRPKGGVPLRMWKLPSPVNAHAGTIPFLKGGDLFLGVDVSARCILRSAGASTVRKRCRYE